MQGPLGRLAPPDDRHIRKYGLTQETIPSLPVPVLFGINWYEQFDQPVKKQDGYWIGLGDDWGAVRGGHAITGISPNYPDRMGWRIHYQQTHDGPCGGYAGSRMMSMLNKRLYEPLELYRAAQKIDDWPGEEPSYYGTSIRAICDVLRTQGPWPLRRKRGGGAIVSGPSMADGIVQNRWATTPEEIARVLGLPPGQEWLSLANSWGPSYPIVKIGLDAVRRLLAEDGECALVTDRPGAANV